MSEPVARASADTAYEAFHHVVPELSGLLEIETDIVRSLCLDAVYGEELSQETLGRIVLTGPNFVEPLPRIVTPAGFHGRSHHIEAFVTPDLDEEFFKNLLGYKAARHNRAVLLTVSADASSSGLSDAGHYGADIVYFTRQVPRLGRAVTHFSGYNSNFPVVRRVASVGWEEGSAFPIRQGKLAKMSDGASPVRKGGGGKVRRLPKHR